MTGELPFYLLIGHNSHLDENITNIPYHSSKVPMVNDQLGLLLQVQNALEGCWEAAIAKQAKFYNKKVKLCEYTMRDLVLLSAANITTTQLSKKLD